MFDRMIGAIAAAMATGGAAADLHHDQIDQTGWAYLTNADLDTVQGLIDDDHRLIDLEVDGNNPLRLTVVAVPNTGPYESEWWWYYNLTIPEVQEFIDQNDARLIDLEAYQTKGGIRFAVIMQPADGVDSVGQTDWEFGLSGSGVESWVDANPTRRIHDLVPYETIFGTKYAFTWINNTGAEASNWWYYLDRTLENIDENRIKNGARLVDLERHEDGRWSALMLPEGDDPWWWFFDLEPLAVGDYAVCRGSRIVDIERYSTPFGDRATVILRRNASDLTLRVNEELRDGLSIASDSGVRCQELDGPVVAGANAFGTFEPAGLMTTFHHFASLWFVAAGADALDEDVSYLRPPIGDTSSRPCDPSPDWTETTESLEQTLFRMMEGSDNHASDAIRIRYGATGIENLASVAGAQDTILNHIIGCFCGAPRNQTTLLDLAAVHAAVAGGILDDADVVFHDIMSNLVFNSVLQSELAASGLGQEDVAEFNARSLEATKSGSYSCVAGNESHRSRGGYFRIPVRLPDCSIVDREYFIGAWVNDATFAEGGLASGNVRDAIEFLYRDRLQTAIASWKTNTCVPCLADLNDDGRVDGADMGLLLVQWGPCPRGCTGDLDEDGDVDGGDLGLLLSSWGECP